MKKLLLIITGIIASVNLGLAQEGGLLDPMLTMYQFQPMNINPALTGNMDSKWRLNAVYREQGYVVHRPYRVAQGSFDIQLPINAWSGNIWGFGLNFVRDDQGDAFLVNNRLNANFALGQYLDPRLQHSISVGFQAGYGTRAIDYGDVYWDNQWVGEGFLLELDPREPLTTDVKGYFDMSTGVQYTYYSGELVEFNGGVSLYHLNRPDVSLYNDTGDVHMSRRGNIHAEFQHKIRDNSGFAVKPSFLYSRQENRGNMLLGSKFQFIFSEGTRTTGKRSESSMDFGLFTRFSTPETGTQLDFLATITMEFAGFTFGGGYDVPLGSFQTINGYEGGFEFMIGYRAGYQRGLYNKYSPKRKGRL